MSLTAATACPTSRTSIYWVRAGSRVSSRILNPSRSHRTGSNSGLCLAAIESVHEAERMQRDIDHFLFGLDEGGIAEAELSTETLVGNSHDRRGALAAYLGDGEKRRRHHVDGGDTLPLEIA